MLITIDKIYIGIVNSCFSLICNRVLALDSCQNLAFTQYLEKELTKLDQILYKFIIIDKIYSGDIKHCLFVFCKFATGLRPLIDVRFWFFTQCLGNELKE